VCDEILEAHTHREDLAESRPLVWRWSNLPFTARMDFKCVLRDVPKILMHTHAEWGRANGVARPLSLWYSAQSAANHTRRTPRVGLFFVFLWHIFFLVREQTKQDVNLRLPLGAVTLKIIWRPATHGTWSKSFIAANWNNKTSEFQLKLTEIHISWKTQES
jgi:hypothetical protein